MSGTLPHERSEYSGRGIRSSLGIGVLALAACIAGGIADPVQFFRAYLPAWLFVFGVALGSMALLMIYHLTGGAWGFLIRRIAEACTRTLPLVAVMFTPIAFGIGYLYPFAQPEQVAANAQLQHETFYMTPLYFWLRAAGYFVLWLAMAFLLNFWSRQQDESDDPRLAWKCQQLSGPGAVVYGVTLHFAAVDWAMSIMPAFHSSIWGPLFALGQLLSALAFTLVVLACVVPRRGAEQGAGSGERGALALAELVSPQALGDLGSLLLTFVVAWAYLAWFQFMLIWIANLPQDIIYYLARSTTFWLVIIWIIVVLHFAVPFFLLLMRPVKRNLRTLAAVAGLLLAMQLLYDYYQVTPSFPASRVGQGSVASAGPPTAAHGGTVQASSLVPIDEAAGAVDHLSNHWMDFLTPIALGGIWLSCFLWTFQGRALIVAGDPQLAAAIRLRRSDDEEAAREEAQAHE